LCLRAEIIQGIFTKCIGAAGGRAARRKVIGIILFNQIIGLTKLRAKGIVRGSVFCLEFDKVKL